MMMMLLLHVNWTIPHDVYIAFVALLLMIAEFIMLLLHF